MDNLRFGLTMISNNRKTGPIPVSTSPSCTCPDSCRLKEKGCASKLGPLCIHWKKIDSGERGLDWYSFCSKVYRISKRQLWRHNQAGDLLPLDGYSDLISSAALQDLVNANDGGRGYAYTAYNPSYGTNSGIIRHANTQGFTINMSAIGLAEADRKVAVNCGPVCAVVPAGSPDSFWTEGNNPVVMCLQERDKSVTCMDCGMCQDRNRGFIIGFSPRGSQKGYVNELVSIS